MSKCSFLLVLFDQFCSSNDFLTNAERSSDSYLGRDDFFEVVVCSGSNFLFRGLIFVNFRSFILLKRRQTPLWNSKSAKFTGNVIDL